MDEPLTPQSLIEDREVKVPSLPEVFLRLDEAINSPRCSLGDIGDILKEDTGLSGRLLKIANSPFYNFPSKIDTITRALTLVGTQQLRDLVLATSVMKLFRDIPQELVDMEHFWRHSIACGVTARVLATYLREGNGEYYYLSGILHDIGYLIIYLQLPEQALELLEESADSGKLLNTLERDRFGFDHADVGGALLEHWSLPPRLLQPTKYHHRPGNAEDYPLESAVLHMADVLVHGMQLGYSGERRIPWLDAQAWRRVGVSVNSLPVLMQQIETQYHDAVDVFLES